jgi:TonB family protein
MEFAMKKYYSLLIFTILVSCSSKHEKDDGYLEIKIEMTSALKPSSFPKYSNGTQGLSDYFKNKLMNVSTEGIPTSEKKVTVSFIVDKFGKVREARIVKGANSYLDSPALKAVAEMPNWIPATNEGETIDFIYQLPIQF